MKKENTRFIGLTIKGRTFNTPIDANLLTPINDSDFFFCVIEGLLTEIDSLKNDVERLYKFVDYEDK